MPKTMLIDAGHQEETRVAVCQGGRVEDFDFEYASRKPLRGNIYLARVTRVEPSLQAAFIEYGGNRHGFLAFGEIHPDYYQIPVADREILRKAEALEVELARKLAERDQHDDDFDPDEDDPRRGVPGDDDVVAEAAGADTDDGDDDAGNESRADERPKRSRRKSRRSEKSDDDFVPGADEHDKGEWHAADETLIEALGEAEAGKPAAKDGDAPSGEEEEEEEEKDGRSGTAAMNAEPGEAVRSDEQASGDDSAEAEPVVIDTSAEKDPEEGVVEDTGAGEKDAEPEARQESKTKDPAEEELQELRRSYEEAKRERNRLLRAYKIQEVIKRRQIMLVQVVKEERGNKGAALTTYLSLAGRYGVLMPNTARGGGISRKISSQSDRKRLKKAMSELDIPSNMGLIIRTAGAKRTKTEIKRDYDYLSRLWERIRERTLESVAPTLIYEEASLIKRAIRDLYDKDTEYVHVQGEEGYREAKDFMKMLMPSHAKFVQQYKGELPIFLKHKVEQQLDEMYQPVVQLKSGGYIVIQQTEALVSIDVNSGRATKERNVEATALKTNSEAAVEVARQCRLRDLAGLIVVDFIDMEENRNNRAVEKKLKEAMKTDRARTQIGSISTFGLLEMSRQRRRSGIVDGTTQACPVCEGAGAVRSHEMAALRILRASEGVASSGKHGLITVKTSTEVALYILNAKRYWLERMEKVYGVKTNILADSGKFGDQYDVQGSGAPTATVTLRDTIGDEGPLTELDAPELPGPESREDEAEDSSDDDDRPKRRRRRRRRKGGGESSEGNEGQNRSGDDSKDGEGDKKADTEAKSDDDARSDDEDGDDDGSSEESKGDGRKRRRRGRRGGRRNRRSNDGEGQNDENGTGESSGEGAKDDRPDEAPAAASGTEAEAKDEPAEGGEAEAEPATKEIASSGSQGASEPDDAVKSGTAEPEADKSDEAAEEPAGEKAEAAPADDAAEARPQDAPGRTEQEPETEPRTFAAADEPPAEEEQPRDEEAPREPRRVGWWQRAFQKD